MAASMTRRVLQLLPILRGRAANIPAQSHLLQSIKPRTTICRTITHEKMDENKRKFQKRMIKYGLLLVGLILLTPLATELRYMKFEPRRDKKRRKLLARKEAEEREESSHDIESSEDVFQDPFQQSQESSGGVLPVVKAAQVVDEGDGYMPPRSHRFNFIADAVDIAAPSVVYIDNLQGRHPMMGRQQVPISNGSGFIVSPDGLILTNAHVVANKVGDQQAVRVKLPDGRIVTGHVVDFDSVSDLAVVKINDGDKLPAMKLGKSSRLRPGEWVIAMGSPLTLSNTITAGIVSTVSRTSKELGLSKDIDYIQTDAAITFGNSGGPLVNLDGEAIGINRMKVTPGISFAIPIDTAKDFLEEVQRKMKEGESKHGLTGWLSGSKKASDGRPDRRGYLGITMLSLSPALLNDLKSRMADFPNVTHGVLVYGITIGSPAQVGGMKAGDIITHIDGQPVKSVTAVYNAVHALKKMDVAIIRGSQKLTLSIVPEEAQ